MKGKVTRKDFLRLLTGVGIGGATVAAVGTVQEEPEAEDRYTFAGYSEGILEITLDGGKHYVPLYRPPICDAAEIRREYNIKFPFGKWE